jgi:hypothetical protein
MTNERNGRMRHGWALILCGLVIVTFSVLADAVGVGNGDYVFGWEQKLGVLVGTGMVFFPTLLALGWSPSTRTARTARYEAPVAPVSSASV